MNPSQEDTPQMQLLHAIARTRASLDDPNLIAHAGLPATPAPTRA
jgi:hypothetical protein